MVVKRPEMRKEVRAEARIIDIETRRTPSYRDIPHYKAQPVEIPQNVVEKKSKYEVFLSVVFIVGVVFLSVHLGQKAGLFTSVSDESPLQRMSDSSLQIAIKPRAIDSFEYSMQDLSASLERMEREMERQKSYMKMNAMLEGKKSQDLSDAEKRHMRGMLLRAGYKPDQVEELQVTEKKTVKDDVVFAKGVAKDVVKENIESFLHNVNLITKVGEYVAGRVSGD